MKNLIVLATFVVTVANLTCFTGTASAQTAAPAAAASPTTPMRVGLVDMGQVFKDYKKFEVLRADLKDEISATDEKAKAIAEKGQSIQAELKTFKEGSKEYIDRESDLTKLSTEFEAFRKNAQREFERAEAKIYQQIYLEVVDAVKKAAKYHNYTMVMRFTRPDYNVTDPKKVPLLLNQQVVYYDPEDDLTEAVVDYLNRRYEAAAAKIPGQGPAKSPSNAAPAKKASAIKQTSGTK